jgi:alpha-aminoadipate/glutamate carrier protein LysW
LRRKALIKENRQTPIGFIGLEDSFMITCPVCDAAIDVEEDELDEGDEFTCDECAANLRVVSVAPVELEPAEEDDEDEDDEEVDYDEDEDEEEEEEEEDEDWR